MLLLPSLHSAVDEEDKKNRRFRSCCGTTFGQCLTLSCRGLLLFVLPIAGLAIPRWLSGRWKSGITGLALVLWIVISMLATALECTRTHLRQRRTRVTALHGLSFGVILIATYVLQMTTYALCLSSTALEVYPFHPHIPAKSLSAEPVLQRRTAAPFSKEIQRRMRGFMKLSTGEALTLEPDVDVGDLLAQAVVADERAFSALSPLVAAHSKLQSRGVISVVIACHNEHSYMERTLESIVNSTSPGVLREIMIVDDASDPPMRRAYDTRLFRAPFVHIRRNDRREGLIRSKALGGDAAAGEIIVFLDGHVKPDPGWVTPILRHINSNYKRVVVPKIPILDGDTWQVNRRAVGEKMMFNWDLSFHWFTDSDGDSKENNWVPCMSGGLLAISKKWWLESGALDTGMQVWGGENIEQSLRIWLCGGEIVLAPDSVIAHVFRSKFPYDVDSYKVLKNKIRTVEVWFDEYKDRYYEEAGPAARSLRPAVSLPYSGKGSFVDPEVEGIDTFANISGRLQLREQLECKPFSWYIAKFENIFRDRNMLPLETYLIRNPSSDLCMTKVTEATKKAPATIEMKPCDEEDLDQRWLDRYNGTGIQALKDGYCLDAATGKMPMEWRSAYRGSLSRLLGSGQELKHRIELYPCNYKNVNQIGWQLSHGRMTFGSFCAEAASLEDKVLSRADAMSVPILKGCAVMPLHSPSLEDQNTQPPFPVLEKQHFVRHAVKIFQPKELHNIRPI